MKEPVGRRHHLSKGSAAPRIAFSPAAVLAMATLSSWSFGGISAHPWRLYQIFDTSDLPGGGQYCDGYTSQLLKTLAEHDDVDGVWCFADEASAAAAKASQLEI